MATSIYLCVAAGFVLLAWWLIRGRSAAAPGKRASLPPYRPRAIKARFAPLPYAEVVEHYEQAIARQATAPRFRLLITTHYDEQAYEAALAVSQRFQQALAADFGVPDLALHAHLHTCIGEPQQAVAAYTQMLEQPRYLPSIYNNRGYAYNILGEYLLAIQDFNQAIALRPTMAFAYNNRGLALHRLGMSPEGRADIEHSLRLDSQNAYAYRNLGIYYFDQGDFPTALELFERAHRIGTAPPELADYLRKTRQQLGLSSATDEQLPASEN